MHNRTMPLQTAEYWEEKAQRASERAENMREGNARQTILAIARSYRQMAASTRQFYENTASSEVSE
jgi:hypothetical protein